MNNPYRTINGQNGDWREIYNLGTRTKWRHSVTRAEVCINIKKESEKLIATGTLKMYDYSVNLQKTELNSKEENLERPLLARLESWINRIEYGRNGVYSLKDDFCNHLNAHAGEDIYPTKETKGG